MPTATYRQRRRWVIVLALVVLQYSVSGGFARRRRQTYNRVRRSLGVMRFGAEPALEVAGLTWVHEGVFAAGGAHIPSTWAGFTDQTRISSIVHLNAGEPMEFAGPCPEAFLWLGVEREGEADLEDRWLVGRFIRRQIEAGRSVLLHGGAGRHRTRWAFTAFLLVQGSSLGAALRRVEKPPWLAPYHTDLEAWQAFVEWLERGSPGPIRGSA